MNMKVSKTITIRIPEYQSLKLGIEDAPSFEVADAIIIKELNRLQIRVNPKIKQCLLWKDKKRE